MSAKSRPAGNRAAEEKAGEALSMSTVDGRTDRSCEAAPFQLMPPLSAAEYAELRADIEAHGVQVPILVDEHDAVIDGHHRQEIASRLGVPCPSITVQGYSDVEKRDMAYRLNLHRRHLTQEQKRAALAASIKADPGKSNRQHAERVGTDHKTAGAVRDELASTGEIPQLTHTTGADGKDRPVKPSPAETAYDELDRAESTVLAAIDRNDPGAAADRARADIRARWSRLIARVAEIDTMRPEAVAAVLDDTEYAVAAGVARNVVKFLDQVGAHRRPGLRAVGGKP